MEKAERRPYRLIRWIGIVLTFLAWGAFLISFFLPTAAQIGFMWSGPSGMQSGWQTFVESLTLSVEVAASYPDKWLALTILLCLLSPLPNGLMLLAPLANLRAKRYAAVPGAVLFFSGILAIWVCLRTYTGLTIGFYVWIASILLMALASFLISATHAMEDNEKHAQQLKELKKAHGDYL